MGEKKAVSAGCQEGRESQSANYRKLLRELSPRDCCFGSVASFMTRPVNQLCNRMLLCKLRYLIPTVLCQRGCFLFLVFCFVVLFFSPNPTVGHRSKLFSWLLFSCCQFGAGGKWKKLCLTHTSFKYMQGSIVSKMQELGTLRHWRNRIMRRAHLSKYFIQPLKGTVKVYLYPAWSARYILSMIFSSPTLETES